MCIESLDGNVLHVTQLMENTRPFPCFKQDTLGENSIKKTLKRSTINNKPFPPHCRQFRWKRM